MWVFTTDGFYSVVQHPRDDGILVVRSRAREDMTALRERFPTGPALFINHTPDRDYAYRMLVPREYFQRHMDEAIERVDYGNFKSEVYRLNPERAGLYGEVWATMLELQETKGA